jgi:Domain of unknown function (DUF4335)
MESDSLTNRTYTALTCKLIVSKDKQSSGLDLRSGSKLNSQKQHLPVYFTLHLDHPDHGESERITLNGQFHQLDRLQQVVSKYITELVAKFPFPTMNNNSASESMRSINTNHQLDMSTPDIDPENSIGNNLYPSNESPSQKSGLMKNLPGLRNSSAKFTAASESNPPQNPANGSGISKLFGGWKKQHSSKKSQDQNTKLPKTPLGAESSVKSGFGKQAIDRVATAKSETPSLTGSERSLDHQLQLGDLANNASGDTLTLSPIQLFDLSNVLDEYAVDAEIVDEKNPQKKNSATFSRANIPANVDQVGEVDTTAVSLSRLPNLPRTFSSSQTSQVYNRTQTSQHSQRSRSSGSLFSAIPWAAAAAVVVGVPFLFPNQLKDATSKVKIPAIKIPDMEGVKKNVTAAMSPSVVDPEPTNLPKPWEAQPVQPPQVNGNPTPLTANKQTANGIPLNTGTQPVPATSVPLNTGTQPIQADSKLGLAPLPQTLDGIPELPTTAKIPATNVKSGILSGLPRSSAQSIIAPNPLSSSQLPLGSVSTKPITKSGTNAAKPANTVIPGGTTGLKQGKTSAAINPGAVSVSTQPILLPSDLPGIGINAAGSAAMPAPTTKPKTPKQKVKPAAAKTTKQNAATATGIDTIRQPTFDRSSPVPATANFNQEQPQTTSESKDFPIIPVIPTQSFSPSSVVNGPEETTTDIPALKEAKRYFKSKWKASSSESEPLQYVVQINGKSGTVKSVSPQGEAATTYLQQSKVVKPGQKLVAPVAGGTNQKIRVVLQPDGNVDTFVEPE